MMLVSSRWTMLVLAGALVLGCNEATGPLSLPAAVGRPAEASQGPRVGVIVAVGGGVTIVPSKGSAFTGLPDQQLLRDDSLVTAADSFVVVQLHNGHLVRLGASQRNVVEMLASFHDPLAVDDAEARFVRLLTPDERDDPALRGAITRVAGWNTRMSAAQTFAALPPTSPTAAPAEAAARLEAPAPEAPTPEAEEAALRDEPLADVEQASADGAMRSDGKGRPRTDPALSAAKKSSTSTEAPGSPSPSGAGAREDKASTAPRLPDKLKFTPASGGPAQQLDLPATLKAGGAALARCAGAGAKIKGRVKDHKLVELTVDGAAKCQELVGKANALADGSFELTVTP